MSTTHTVTGIVSQTSQNAQTSNGTSTVNITTTIAIAASSENTGMFAGVASGSVTINANGLAAGTPFLLAGETATLSLTQ